MRVKITLSYNGAAFFGFQSQTSTSRTVSGALKKAFLSVGIKENFYGSGRTDSGVHASAQVIHIDLPQFWSDFIKLKKHLNKSLTPNIYVKHIQVVSEDFHARFSAKSRVYRYVISTSQRNPFSEQFITFSEQFDYALMQEALKKFEGTHDFGWFKKNGSITSSNVRTINKAFIYKFKEHYIVHFSADGYLRSQIRMIIYIVLEIAKNRLPITSIAEQLGHIKRHSTNLAPPNGLYLAKIKY